MKKQTFLGHSYSPADFKSSESTVTLRPSDFSQSENFSCFFLVLLIQIIDFDSKQFSISKTS